MIGKVRGERENNKKEESKAIGREKERGRIG